MPSPPWNMLHLGDRNLGAVTGCQGRALARPVGVALI